MYSVIQYNNGATTHSYTYAIHHCRTRRIILGCQNTNHRSWLFHNNSRLIHDSAYTTVPANATPVIAPCTSHEPSYRLISLSASQPRDRQSQRFFTPPNYKRAERVKGQLDLPLSSMDKYTQHTHQTCLNRHTTLLRGVCCPWPQGPLALQPLRVPEEPTLLLMPRRLRPVRPGSPASPARDVLPSSEML